MTILDKITATKRDEVARLRPTLPALMEQAKARVDRRDWAGALASAKPVSLIAEIKKASPSAGVIQPDFDPVNMARQYETAGAHALSVLTDEQYFQGRIAYLESVRQAVNLPILRKDFTIDELQIYEAAAKGADAILLIVAILDDARLRSFQQLAGTLRLAALVEVHDERELDRALDTGGQIIGINNRNLKDFSVDLATTERLAARIPAGKLIVAESGIHTAADARRVRAAGASAILVGESLMRSGNVAGKVRELLGS
jgi:indole-3-glycerol phosphate synthase